MLLFFPYKFGNNNSLDGCQQYKHLLAYGLDCFMDNAINFLNIYVILHLEKYLRIV